MDYYQELIRRVLGVEEVEIPIGVETIPQPGPYLITIHTQNATLPMTMLVEFSHNKMTTIMRDAFGAPLWIRHFNFKPVQK